METPFRKGISVRDVVPAYATHPGEILRDELEARNISQNQLAKMIDRPQQWVNSIVTGKRGINATTALLLEKALDIDAVFWVRLQGSYELDLVRIAQRDGMQAAA